MGCRGLNFFSLFLTRLDNSSDLSIYWEDIISPSLCRLASLVNEHGLILFGEFLILVRKYVLSFEQRQPFQLMKMQSLIDPLVNYNREYSLDFIVVFTISLSISFNRVDISSLCALIVVLLFIPRNVSLSLHRFIFSTKFSFLRIFSVLISLHNMVRS